MRRLQEQKFDAVQYKQDRQAYNYWFHRQFGAENDEDTAQKVSNTIYAAIQMELSEKQRIYFCAYYLEGLTVNEIASTWGVNKSTVSRTIARARKKLGRVLKYVDQRLMRLFKQADRPKIRQNKEGGQRFVPAGPGWAHETRTNKGE